MTDQAAAGCDAPGCTRGPHTRGLCRPHYLRLLRNGVVGDGDIRVRRAPGTECEIDECDHPTRGGARGLCEKHYTRWLRHGDPNVVILDRDLPAGADHANWRGSDAGYFGVHSRLRRERGRAQEYFCRCGAQAQQWSYDHSDPAEVISAEGLPYSHDLQRYTPKCVPCHKTDDLAWLAQPGRFTTEGAATS